ncbi:MAG: phosphotransferase family protein [Longimicrobiales bacterium]
MLSTRERVLPRAASSSGGWFLLKADIDEPDSRLRSLRRPDGAHATPSVPRLASAVGAAVGVPVRAIESRAQPGTFHWVICALLEDDRRVVVRINRLRHPLLTAGLLLDARLGELLPAQGLRVAGTLGIDTRCGTLPFEFAVFEHIDGVRADEVDADEERTRSALRSLGSYLRAVHEIRLPGSGPVTVRPDGSLYGPLADWPAFLRCRVDEHLAVCLGAGSISAAEAAEVRETFAHLEAVAVRDADRLLHGDAGPANVLLDDADRIHLVDWEDALVGDPLFELASTASFHPPARWPALFEGYGVMKDTVVGHDRAFWVYMLRIALARTVMRQRFGIADTTGRPPASTRIQRALAALRGEQFL